MKGGTTTETEGGIMIGRKRMADMDGLARMTILTRTETETTNQSPVVVAVVVAAAAWTELVMQREMHEKRGNDLEDLAPSIRSTSGRYPRHETGMNDKAQRGLVRRHPGDSRRTCIPVGGNDLPMVDLEVVQISSIGMFVRFGFAE